MNTKITITFLSLVLCAGLFSGVSSALETSTDSIATMHKDAAERSSGVSAEALIAVIDYLLDTQPVARHHPNPRAPEK